jgi:hypothetical protein
VDEKMKVSKTNEKPYPDFDVNKTEATLAEVQ